MAKIIGLPKLSPTMDEGTLVSWAKKEGDAIEVDDLLAEVETDKATMEFRSFDKGVLLKILAAEGDTLPAEAPVAIIGEAGEDISALVAQAESMKKAGGGSGGAPAASATEAGTAAPSPEAPAPSAATGAAAPTEAASTAPERVVPGGRVMASPLVRRLAREHDVDLASVEGSGPHGRIVKKDFDAFVASGGASARGARHRPAPSRETRVEKISQMRKTIARRLTESKRDVPHYYLTIDVDVEALLATRAAINEDLAAGGSGDKISVNDMVIKACAMALRRSPQVNASFQGDTIHYYGRVDISVAVAIPEGLITPVVRDADVKDFVEIGREVRALAKRARDKKLKPEEFTGGTFSISNLGMYGIEEFTAVINPPEGAILAVGTIRDEPVVKHGVVVPGQRMRMTMSCDHRVIDGATGAQFLQVVKRMLETPALMLV